MSLELFGYGSLVVIGVILSGLFSGTETGLYTLNRVRLAVRAGRGDRSAVRLRAELANQSRMLSTLLIGTNASSYLASYGLAATLHGFGLGDWTLIAVEAAVFTPVLFVFAETLPKDLFRTHTDHWTYTLSGMMVVSRWVFVGCGLLPVVQFTARLASRFLGAPPEAAASARQHISQLIKEGVGTGVLSESQTTLADRALAMRDRTVAAEMVPWHKVVTVSLDADRAARERLMRRRDFTRFPVVDRAGRVVGILPLLEALLQPGYRTTRLMTEPIVFSASMPLREALRSLRSHRRAMAIVVEPSSERPVGLVTLKDLVEPITGELGAW